MFFFCFRRRYLVNPSSLAPFKGGGFIVSCDAEVRSRPIGGADCDNGHCSWDQEEVAGWRPGADSVALESREVFICLRVHASVMSRVEADVKLIPVENSKLLP